MTNRMVVCLLATLALLLSVTTPIAAQEDVYVVQHGDNLWNLAGAHLDDARLWEQIYKDNPFLQEPGRRFQKDGIVYVMVRPGEKLVGLEKVGIMATLTSIDRLQLPQQTAVYEVPTTPVWVWWPLALAIAILIVAWLIYRMLTRDPVNARPAMVPGGVTEANATIAMQQVAARSAGHDPGASRELSVYQQFTIVRQTAGRIWGVLMTRYQDGRQVPRRYDGQRAYEAEVRFPDGRTETLYMLQGCGNDLRYGGISRYLPGPEFRFEADPVPATVPAQPVPEPAAEPTPAPEPAPAPAPVAPAPAPVAEAPTPVQTTPTPPRASLMFEMKRSVDGEPHLVRFDSDQVEEFFIGRDRRITIRYREPEPAAPNK